MHAQITRQLLKFTCLPAILLLLIVSTAAHAAGEITGEIVSVGIGGAEGKRGIYRAGYWVPVRVRLENRSGRQFEGRIGVEQADLDDDQITSLSRPFILDAKAGDARDFWVYYWPRPNDQLRGIGSVVIFGKDGGQPIARITGAGGEASAIGLAPRDQQLDKSCKFIINIGPAPLGLGAFTGSNGGALGGSEGVRYQWVTNASDLPDRALGLDGVDMIVWQADHVRGTPDQMPTEFQLKAMLEWVKSGGHLVISVATHWRDLADPSSPMAEVLPLRMSSIRTLNDMVQYAQVLGESAPINALNDSLGVYRNAAARMKTPIPQVVGTLTPGARRAFDRDRSEAPLVVTGQYGQGVVTVVTVDLSHRQFVEEMSDLSWLRFWQQIMGTSGDMMSRAIFDNNVLIRDTYKRDVKPHADLRLQTEDNLNEQVDVTEVTFVRLVLALLFLAVYWVVAGPGGHFALRYYQRTHWSWWVFGATVVAAAIVAGIFVFSLQITSYDLRHRTYVMGQVNSPNAHVLGFYGVFAPDSGFVRLGQAETQVAGLNYLVPFTEPRLEKGLPFPDPQSYFIDNEKPNIVNMPFRSTLKKLQGRWSGEVPGLEGTAWLLRPDVVGGEMRLTLQGSLTNKTGHELDRVLIIAGPENLSVETWQVYRIIDGKNWPAGGVLQLDRDCELIRTSPRDPPITLGDLLYQTGGVYASRTGMGGPVTGMTGMGGATWQHSVAQFGSGTLLQALADARRGGRLTESDRVEIVRHFTRHFDRTRALRGTGGLVIGRAGNAADKRFVPCPVPITIDDRMIDGKGEIVFAWTLPIQTIAEQKKK